MKTKAQESVPANVIRAIRRLEEVGSKELANPNGNPKLRHAFDLLNDIVNRTKKPKPNNSTLNAVERLILKYVRSPSAVKRRTGIKLLESLVRSTPSGKREVYLPDVRSALHSIQTNMAEELAQTASLTELLSLRRQDKAEPKVKETKHAKPKDHVYT
jgi:hypothetical protein